MSSALDWFSNINWSNPGWDVIVLLFFVIGALVYGMAMGRSRIIVILMSIYITLAIANAVPWDRVISGNISFNNALVLQAGVFIVLLIALFFLISRSAVGRVIGDSGGKWWHVLLFSFLQVGLLISVIMSFLPFNFLANFSELTREIFIGDIGRIVWLVLPIAGMLLVKENED
ncbi:MAG: hypothetical protein ACOZBH_00105 [Patescibacteria group bacterium]